MAQCDYCLEQGGRERSIAGVRLLSLYCDGCRPRMVGGKVSVYTLTAYDQELKLDLVEKALARAAKAKP